MVGKIENDDTVFRLVEAPLEAIVQPESIEATAELVLCWPGILPEMNEGARAVAGTGLTR